MSVRKSLAWAFSGQAATLAVNFGGSIVIARLLSPEEMGVYALALATSGILAVVATFGISSYVVREVDLSDEKLASAFTITAGVNTCLALMIFAASFWIDSGNATVGYALRLLALPPLIGILEFRPLAMMQREMRFHSSSTIITLATTINVAVTIALAWLGYSSLSMPYAAIAAAIFRAVAFNAVLPRHAKVHVSLRHWRPIMTFGLRMLTIRGAAVMAQRASEMILGKLLGLAALGIYTRASILSSQIFFNVYGTATGVVFTEMSRKYRETGVVRDTFLRGLDMILAVMWPMVIGLAILARPAITILYGPKWIDAALPLSLLMIAQFLALSYGMNWELFVLRDETAKQSKYELFRAAAGLLIFAVGATFGLAAATTGRVLDVLIGAIIYLPQMTRLADIEAREIRLVYRNGLLLTLAAVIPSLVVMVRNDWAGTTSPVQIAAGILLGGCFWLATLRALKHTLYGELARIVSLKALRVSPLSR